MLNLVLTFWSYLTRRRAAFKSREALHAHQMRELDAHLDWLSGHSEYFGYRLAPHDLQPPAVRLAGLPVLDKATWLERFDECNTAGLRLMQVQHAVAAVESQGNLVTTLNGLTVGVSWDGAGPLDLFVVGRREQARWTGMLVSKLLPRGVLGSGERIALFADPKNCPYLAVESMWLKLRCYDPHGPLEVHAANLAELAPTIIVGSAGVLRDLALSKQGPALAGCTVFWVGANIDEKTDQLLVQRFSAVRQVYREGELLLAASCSHGKLHLNEENVLVEGEWLDEQRFAPVVTDLSRTTQPLVRLRLDTVLRMDPQPCSCGNPTHTVAAVETPTRT